MKRLLLRHSLRRPLLTSLVLILFMGVLSILTPKTAHAAAYVVDTTSDANLTACTAAVNDCSLRGAINDATVAGGAVTFDTTVFATAQTITLTSPLPFITNSATITITGPGAALLTIDGGNAYQPFETNTGTTVSISNMTIA